MSFGLVFVIFMGGVFSEALFLFLTGTLGLIVVNACKDTSKDLRNLEIENIDIITKEQALERLEKLNLLIERASNNAKSSSIILRGFIDDH